MASGQLVVFDVEGVIIPKGHFLFKIVQQYKPRQLPKLVFYGFLYFLRLVSIKTAIKGIFRILQGLPEEMLQHVISEISLKPRVAQVFRRLKENECRTAAISSGIPQSALNFIASQLGIDHAVGLLVEVEASLLTGEISGRVLERDGKGEVLEKLIKDNGYGDYRVVSIADDWNNLSLFKSSSIKIGYNPDFLIKLHSNQIVNGELINIIPVITEKKPCEPRVITWNTILRKAVHASSILIPLLLVDLIGKPAVIQLLLLTMVLYFVSETLRVLGGRLPLFTWFTLLNTTDSEASEFVDDPIFFALGIALPLVLFPENVAFASISVLALGDSVASLTGILLGRYYLPFFKEKTLEGTFSGFIAAYIGASLFLDPMRALFASFCGTVVETLPSPLNDDLVISLVAGVAAILI